MLTYADVCGQHTSAYVEGVEGDAAPGAPYVSIRQRTSAYVRAYVSIRQSIREHIARPGLRVERAG
jgi:hypothetical protein